MAQSPTGWYYSERELLRNKYIRRDRRRQNEAVKQIPRNMVLDHIEQHHADVPPRLFSLPSTWWKFERQFLKRFPDASLLAVEQDTSIFRRGKKYMPGRNKHRVVESVGGKELQSYQSSRARILQCNAGALMHADRRELPEYRGWTCAWWDLMSYLGPISIGSLMQTERFLDPTVQTCPVSVTLYVGREKGEIVPWLKNLVPEDVSPAERRVVALERWLNRFNRSRRVAVEDFFSYSSEAGGHMLLIHTLFHRKAC
jgi:hypothetical protein